MRYGLANTGMLAFEATHRRGSARVRLRGKSHTGSNARPHVDGACHTRAAYGQDKVATTRLCSASRGTPAGTMGGRLNRAQQESEVGPDIIGVARLPCQSFTLAIVQNPSSASYHVGF